MGTCFSKIKSFFCIDRRPLPTVQLRVPLQQYNVETYIIHTPTKTRKYWIDHKE